VLMMLYVFSMLAVLQDVLVHIGNLEISDDLHRLRRRVRTDGRQSLQRLILLKATYRNMMFTGWPQKSKPLSRIVNKSYLKRSVRLDFTTVWN